MKGIALNEHAAYGRIPKGWFNENPFIKSLTNGERWILTCLTAQVWRLEKPNRKFSMSKLLSRLYRDNQLLVSMMNQRDIAEKCGINRSTVISAIKKFEETGAVISISGGGGIGHSNFYLMGFEHRDKNETGYSKKIDLWFSNCPSLAGSGVMDSQLKEFIKSNYDKSRARFIFNKPEGFSRRIISSIFDNSEPASAPRDQKKSTIAYLVDYSEDAIVDACSKRMTRMLERLG